MTDDELCDRALKSLRRAIEEAGPELTLSWVANGDPDFNFFRQTQNPAWTELMARLARRGVKPPQPPSKIIADEAKDAAGTREPAEGEGGPPKPQAPTPIVEPAPEPEPGERPRPTVSLPESPLGHPRLRFWGWSLVALGLAAAALVVALALGLPWPLTIVAVVALAVRALRAAHQAFVARDERRPVASKPGATTRADEKTREPEPPASAG